MDPSLNRAGRFLGLAALGLGLGVFLAIYDLQDANRPHELELVGWVTGLMLLNVVFLARACLALFGSSRTESEGRGPWTFGLLVVTTLALGTLTAVLLVGAGGTVLDQWTA